VTDANAVERWVIARDDEQPIDLLIANAGVGGAATMAPVGGESGPLARHIFSVNTLGVINTVTAVLARMVQRQRGHIVMVSSLAGYVGVPDAPVYSASKAAVRVYGDGIRRLVRSAHVKVTVVSPGFVETPMSASLPARGAFEWSVDRAADYIVARVARGARQVVFPWPLRLGVALASALPVWFVDRCFDRLRLPPQ
jgi:short-subunit dehydrogenase